MKMISEDTALSVLELAIVDGGIDVEEKYRSYIELIREATNPPSQSPD